MMYKECLFSSYKIGAEVIKLHWLYKSACYPLWISE